MVKKVKAVAIIAILALLLMPSVRVTAAAELRHYAFDKPYYSPGEAGALTLTFNPGDDVVTEVDLEIDGLATFRLVPSSQCPSISLASTGTTTVELLFAIPANATLGEEYGWALRIEFSSGAPLSYNGTMTSEEQPLFIFTLTFLAPLLGVALGIVLPLIARRYARHRFTRRMGLILMVAAPALFVLSMLFLANNNIYPSDSPQYRVGQLLGLFAAPLLLASGATVYATARHAKAFRAPAKTCSSCGRDLSKLPMDITTCPYCGAPLGEREEEGKGEGEGGRKKGDGRKKVEMPHWERTARRIYMYILLGLIIASLCCMTSLPHPVFAVPIILVPLIFILYLRSGRRGWFGAAALLLFSLIAYLNNPYDVFAQLLFGSSGRGLIDRYLDCAAGITTPLTFILTIRTLVTFSAGIFLVVARLLQYRRFSPLWERKAVKAVVVCLLLLPLGLSLIPYSPDTDVNPLVITPPGSSWWAGPQGCFLSPSSLESSRIFDENSGTWTYTLMLSNPSRRDITITQLLAGRETVPFSSIVANGSGITVKSDGVVYMAGCYGAIQFTIETGHNHIIIRQDLGGECAFSWG